LGGMMGIFQVYAGRIVFLTRIPLKSILLLLL
jgi:hypothetical protein